MYFVPYLQENYEINDAADAFYTVAEDFVGSIGLHASDDFAIQSSLVFVEL